MSSEAPFHHTYILLLSFQPSRKFSKMALKKKVNHEHTWSLWKEKGGGNSPSIELQLGRSVGLESHHHHHTSHHNCRFLCQKQWRTGICSSSGTRHSLQRENTTFLCCLLRFLNRNGKLLTILGSFLQQHGLRLWKSFGACPTLCTEGFITPTTGLFIHDT